MAGALAHPEPEAYHSKAAYPKPAYVPEYKAPVYGKKYEYCDPRALPKCALNETAILCLTDDEYPAQEIQVTISNNESLHSKQQTTK